MKGRCDLIIPNEIPSSPYSKARACVLVAIAACGLVERAHGGLMGLQRVAAGGTGGISQPMFVTHAPNDPSRLFIAQRGGGIRILNLTTGVLEPTPFLSISGVDTGGEGGLLGMAFHPDYATNGKFYVNVTAADSIANTPFSNYIREYTVSANPNIANTTFNPILEFAQPQSNHNGGWIGFKPGDGNHLFIMTGDGGNSNDQGTGHIEPGGNAQNLGTPLGKVLRVNVNADDFPADNTKNYAIPPSNPFVGTAGALGEIFAYGLRNPFRASFDRQTGDLWIGDVGQSMREEIDFIPASSNGGQNFGWRLREGTIATPTVGGSPPAGNVEPVYDYDRSTGAFGGTVVSGGYVYRGPDPSLQGMYFFLDSRNSAGTADDRFWMFNPSDPRGTVQDLRSLLTPNTGSAQFPVSFGEDANGNLYIAFLVSNEVYRIVAIPEPAGAIVCGSIALLLVAARRRRAA